MKEQTNTLIEKDLKEKAKRRGMDLGDFFNSKLREHLEPKKADLPEEKLLMICDLCKDHVDHGFFCEETQRFLCESCEFATTKTDYGLITANPCKKRDIDHIHLRIPNLLGENTELVKKVALRAPKEEIELKEGEQQ